MPDVAGAAGRGCGADAGAPVWPSRVVSVSWGDRHSPDGWEALGGCAGWLGSNVCLSAAHVVEKQCSGWS